jgi:DNA-binding transcriptional LysR family regulator
MDFRSVRYFSEVAATGSLRAAAERLRVADSALSRTIALLEQQLGVVLFDRSRTGMKLTAAGEIYLRYARGLMLDRDRLRAELESLKGLRRGHIRIASIEGAVASLAMAAIRDFHRDFPQVTLELHAGGAEIVRRALTNQEADIGIGASGSYDRSIRVVQQAASPLLALVAPQSTWIDRERPVALEAVLSGAPFAVPDVSFALRRQMEESVPNAFTRYPPALVTNSIDALRSFALDGAGVTFLPRVAVRGDLESGRLLGIPLTDAPLNASTIDLLLVADREPAPATAAFLDYLIEALQRQKEPSRLASWSGAVNGRSRRNASKRARG